MKTGSGIYHTGSVGKDCHVAAKLREEKARDKRQRTPSNESDTPARRGRRSLSEPSRRGRKREDSSSTSRSPSPHEDDRCVVLSYLSRSFHKVLHPPPYQDSVWNG